MQVSVQYRERDKPLKTWIKAVIESLPHIKITDSLLEVMLHGEPKFTQPNLTTGVSYDDDEP